VKNSFFTDLIRIENTRGREIIDGGKAVYESACPRNERIEVRRQNAVDIAAVDQLRKREVSLGIPVKLNAYSERKPNGIPG
jgi:hypothetical protein